MPKSTGSVTASSYSHGQSGSLLSLKGSSSSTLQKTPNFKLSYCDTTTEVVDGVEKDLSVNTNVAVVKDQSGLSPDQFMGGFTIEKMRDFFNKGMVFRCHSVGNESVEHVSRFGMRAPDPSNPNLRDAVEHNAQSAFVHSSKQFEVALGFAKRGEGTTSQIYVIKPDPENSIDISTTSLLTKHGISKKFAYERAVAHKDITPDRILGYIEVTRNQDPEPGAIEFLRVGLRPSGPSSQGSEISTVHHCYFQVTKEFHTHRSLIVPLSCRPSLQKSTLESP